MKDSTLRFPEAPWHPAEHAQAWVNHHAELHRQVVQEGGLPLGTAWQGDPLPSPRWVALNASLASEWGWAPDWADRHEALAVFSGNSRWPGMAPFTSVYSGHQFGVWAGQLGDGRALLLGQVHTPQGPQELQLKGAGATPYSRRADGRAVLRSSIREYLCSEAMHALGIPTTRALCLTASPHPVIRETVETAAVVTRVAPSFIRFGHFEHFAYAGEGETRQAARHTLRALVDHVIRHHEPDLLGRPEPVLTLLQRVVDRTATLMAAWQAVGFCHGVMNTDNMSILGLTIDYGPFGFMDAFDPDHICNHSDHQGRYSWNNQPQIGYWNLRALAQALLALLPSGEDSVASVVAVLQTYEDRFVAAMHERWTAKLGLSTARDDDRSLVMDFLQLMAAHHADFTITFRRLAQFKTEAPVDGVENAAVRDLFLDRAAFDAWARRYATRLRAEGSVDAERAERMRRVNPVYVLRNHLAETAIRRAQAGDDSEVQRLHHLLQRPYDEQAGFEADADFPPTWAQSIEVSCSS
jgi:uncharacterized protein YdiU (UPF0061 family)